MPLRGLIDETPSGSGGQEYAIDRFLQTLSRRVGRKESRRYSSSSKVGPRPCLYVEQELYP